MSTINRVLYYTMQGIRSKDFIDPMEAQAFYDRHVKAHPEYQHTKFSMTEIVVIGMPSPNIDITITFTTDEIQVLQELIGGAIDVNINTVRNLYANNEDTTVSDKMFMLLQSIKEKL